MEYMWAVWKEFLNFIGGRSGLIYWIIFILALGCCFFLGKRERKLLFWPSVLVLIFFFNPFFYRYIGMKFLGGVYWRLMWTLPLSFVIAYTLTTLTCKPSKNILRGAAIVGAIAVLIVTGKQIFTSETYKEKENVYELPQAAIEICDYVDANRKDWKETIIVPNELVCSIRQYSAGTCLLYGRNAGGFISEIGEDESLVYAEMCKEEPAMEVVTSIAKEKGCGYIVFNTTYHRIPENMTEYGYELVSMADEIYAIYQRIE